MIPEPAWHEFNPADRHSIPDNVVILAEMEDGEMFRGTFSHATGEFAHSSLIGNDSPRHAGRIVRWRLPSK